LPKLRRRFHRCRLLIQPCWRPAPEPRQGFTVSRDGFVPGQVTAEPTAERDPFDFDLGPSPFEAKTTAAQSSRSGAVQTSGSERSSSFGFDGVVPARTVETPAWLSLRRWRRSA
jgi:hypothetical protein